MSGWLKTYAGRMENELSAVFLSPILLYFLFFVAGPFFLRFLTENKLLLLNLLTILLGIIIILAAGNVLLLSVGASISVFGTSSIFPTNLSRFSRIFGASATRRATPLFLCGTLGAAATTLTIGFASNRSGCLRFGLFVLLLSASALFLLQIFLTMQHKRNKLVSENKFI